MGSTDRLVRLIGAVVLAPTAFLVGIGSLLGIVLLVLVVLLAGTAAVGFCPLYRLLGLSTRSSAPAAR